MRWTPRYNALGGVRFSLIFEIGWILDDADYVAI